ncbi:MAG: hypothetical protein AB7O67_13570 [Vicinamibacterales bacterium]
MTPRLVLLIGALCLSAGWLLGSVVAPPGAAGQEPAVATGPRPIGRSDAPAPPLAERLKLRLADAPPEPLPDRNPFRFGPARPRAEAPGPPAATGNSEEAPPLPLFPPPPPAPRYVLSGMAANGEGEGRVLTAIIRDATGLHFMTEGQRLPDGATVTAVTESTVSLVLPDGGTMTLSLR